MEDENLSAISLTLFTDGDGTYELTAAFRYEDFAGVGSAWFDRTSLEEFAAAFSEYPLGEAANRGLFGEYWGGKTDDKRTAQEQLSISARQQTASGRIAVRIRVATPYNGRDGETEPTSSASAEVPTTYANLARFAGEMRALISGYCAEAVLQADA